MGYRNDTPSATAISPFGRAPGAAFIVADKDRFAVDVFSHRLLSLAGEKC
jgi:hypothetical protein